MIAPTIVDEITRLLHEGSLSQRKIARRVGVSRTTVNSIAQGKRPDYEARRRQRGDDFIPPAGPPARCPGCGRMVRMPCLACRIQAMQECRQTRQHSRRAPNRAA